MAKKPSLSEALNTAGKTTEKPVERTTPQKTKSGKTGPDPRASVKN